MSKQEANAPHPRREPRLPGPLSLARLEEVFSDCVDFSKREVQLAGDPERVALEAETPEELADQVWEALNPENKVSLFVRFVELSGGSHRDVIRNRY